MDAQQAHQLVKQAIMLGMIQYRNMLKPASDKVKQREAWRYLKGQGLPVSLLDKWVEDGIVKRHKDTTKGQNTPVWYRLSDIQSAIVALRTAEATD